MLVQFLRAPNFMGGIVPSSSVLARAMSRQATGFDAIVELGAGTGAVTRRLVADHPRAALTLIEREQQLARRLARSYSHARVRDGCVHDRVDCLLEQPPRTVAVSSLPFRSLPEDVANATGAAIERFLLADPARRLVQYSYGLREPFAFRDARLSWRRVERVWRNVPPAIVWIAVRRFLNERRRAVPGANVPLRGQRSGASRKRGGHVERRRAVPRRECSPSGGSAAAQAASVGVHR